MTSVRIRQVGHGLAASPAAGGRGGDRGALALRVGLGPPGGPSGEDRGHTCRVHGQVIAADEPTAGAFVVFHPGTFPQGAPR